MNKQLMFATIAVIAWCLPLQAANAAAAPAAVAPDAAKAQTDLSDPEALRATLRNILEMQQETAMMIGSTATQESAARALEQLAQLTSEELEVFDGVEGSLSKLQSQQRALQEQIYVLEASIPNLGEVVQQSLQYSRPLRLGELTGKNHIGLTAPNYGSICSSNPFGSPPNTPNRSDRDAKQGLVIGITISDELLVAAEGVRDQADVVCNGVFAGFNPQNLACLVSSALYTAANVANKALHISFKILTFCDAVIDGAEIEGAFERASDIHAQNVEIDGDLVVHDANIAADLAAHDANIAADLAAHDANIDADLIAHDANIDADLIAHDANIDADLAAHDADIKSQLATHDAEIKALLANLQGTVDENQRLIQIFMSRQLESMRLQITPNGQREVDEEVLTCAGANCPVYPAFQLCPDGSLEWNCN